MVAQDGRPHSIARKSLRDAMMRLGEPLFRHAAADDLDGSYDDE